MAGKAFYMTGLEFSILVSTEKIKTYYGLNLQENQPASRENIIQAVYGMIKRGWGKVVNQSIQFKDEIKLLFHQIASAKSLLSVKLENGRRWICYLGKDIVTIVGERNGMLYVQGMEYEELNGWIEEAILSDKPFWETEAEAQESVNGNEASFLEQRMLQQGEYETVSLIAEIEVRGETGSVLFQTDVFMRGITNIWVIHRTSEEEKTVIAPDSAEEREKAISQWKEYSGWF